MPTTDAKPTEVPLTSRQTWAGVAMLVLCAALWSLNGPLIKLLQQEQVSGVTIACYRSLVGGLFLLPIAWRRMPTLRNAAPAWPIASVLLFTLMTVCFCIGTTMTAASSAILLQYTSPIWVFLLARVFLKERPGWTEGLVLVVALVGVAVIFTGQFKTEALGLFVSLGSGFGYGALTVALRGLRKSSPLAVTTMNTLASALLLLVPTMIWGSLLLPSAKAWTLVVFMGVVQLALPYAMFSWGLQRVEAHRAALIVLLETVLNPMWTWLIVGEPVPDATMIGGPLILAGVTGWLLLSWRRAARERSRARSVAGELPPAA